MIGKNEELITVLKWYKTQNGLFNRCRVRVRVREASGLKLSTRWRIYPIFHVSLLERDVTRKAVYQKIADQLEFEEGEQRE